MRERVVEVRHASAVGLEQQLDEVLGVVEPFADHALPQRRRVGAAWRHHALAAHVQALAEGGDRGGRAVGQAAEQRRVGREKL